MFLLNQPDWCRNIPRVPPLLGGADVHAPQLPVVAVARVFIPHQLERVLFDVIDGGKNNAFSILFNSRQNWFSPIEKMEEQKRIALKHS